MARLHASPESPLLVPAAVWIGGAVTRPAMEDRRSPGRRLALVRRIREEFEDLPGMCLTIGQAVRLYSLPTDACERILTELERDGVVALNAAGHYVNRKTMECWRPA